MHVQLSALRECFANRNGFQEKKRNTELVDFRAEENLSIPGNSIPSETVAESLRRTQS